eukprot:m.178015 g.178015  ORF g.178015 m.178015 type:complete len:531 (+) comp31920_c2_seq2:148-1740(+)
MDETKHSSTSKAEPERSNASDVPLAFSTLLKLGLPAMVNNAAAPIAAIINVALIAHATKDHTESTNQVAAYALVAGTCGFALNIFNFVVSVTMSLVGESVGKKKWSEVGGRVRISLVVAIVTGFLCAIVVFVLKSYLFELFGASDVVQTAAAEYFLLRLATIPLLFICRVCWGVISGYQRVFSVSLLSFCIAAFDVFGNYVALYHYNTGLKGSGIATLAATGFGVVALVIGMRMWVPDGAKGEIKWLPQMCSRNPRTESKIELRKTISGYLASSGNMMVRSLLLQGCMFSLYILSSRLGTSALAAHHIIFQLWSLTSYVCDGFADVGTMLGAKLLGMGQVHLLRQLANRLVLLGSVVGVGVTITLYGARSQIQALFTHDPLVRDELNSNWVLLYSMQVVNASVFVYDGVLYAFGSNGFMYIRNLMLIGCLLIFTPGVYLAFTHYHTLLALWVVKNMLTTWRCLSAVFYINIWKRKETSATTPKPSSPSSSLSSSLSSSSSRDVNVSERKPLLNNRGNINDDGDGEFSDNV